MKHLVLVINMKTDTARMDLMRQQLSLAQNVEVERIDGVMGGELSDTATLILTKNDWSPDYKGVLGCFLSHLKAWEAVIRNERAALIIEDDVIIGDLSRLDSIALSDDVDLVFCNDRTSFPGTEGLRSLSPTLDFIGSSNSPPGSDGYILTPRGARKLVQAAKRDGLYSHIDLRLVAYCVTDLESEAAKHLSQCNDTIHGIRLFFPETKLNALSLWPPLIVHNHNESVRSAQDILGKLNSMKSNTNQQVDN